MSLYSRLCRVMVCHFVVCVLGHSNVPALCVVVSDDVGDVLDY